VELRVSFGKKKKIKENIRAKSEAERLMPQ
jgi:hypothetical protein